MPYTDESNHLDIIEIDAASNRRIDEIRDLRERVHVTPTSSKYKVYIIDEVHMLTREAFNALLKTLEEPPAHVIFILATTEAHKLPETIVSRTQRFSFRPVPLEQVVAHLRSIAESEKIKVDDDALELIAEHGEGSFRDSISLLDQARNQAEAVSVESVQAMLGVAPATAIDELVQALAASNAAKIVQTLSQLTNQGYEAAMIAKQFSSRLRTDLLTGKPALSANKPTELLTKLLDVPGSSDPKSLLELVLLDIAFSDESSRPPVSVINTESKSEPPAKKATKKTEESAIPQSEHEQPVILSLTEDPVKKEKSSDWIPDQVGNDKKEATGKTSKEAVAFDENLWPLLLESIKREYNTLYSVLRMATPDFSASGEVRLGFAFAFHQKRLNEPKNRDIIAAAVKELTGQPVTIICELREDTPAAKLPKPQAETPTPESSTAEPTIDTISNIFGGAELLE